MLTKAAFLDRDGVINKDTGYVYRWKDFIFVPGVIEAMHQLTATGYLLIVVTNQSGIARGKYTEDQYQILTRQLKQHLLLQGIHLAGVYHCPHHIRGRVEKYAVHCSCRKPQPGLLLRAAEEHGINMQASVMFGDKPSDMEAARLAGIGRAYFIRSENSESSERAVTNQAFYSLAEGVAWMLNNTA